MLYWVLSLFVIALAIATAAAQLVLFCVWWLRWRAPHERKAQFRWLVALPAPAVILIAVVAVVGGAAWPLMAAIGELFPVAVLNAAQEAFLGSVNDDLSLLACYVVAFAPLALFARAAGH
jgi:formate hydrogenlyase subunit 3/multisubunit Na+/H+ antiporter MnhD subunit